LAGILAGSAAMQESKPGAAQPEAKQGDKPMQLGNFSVSLTVKDLEASRAFYEKLGFRAKSGVGGKKWAVLQNETCTIGLFQGMFEKNMLTFNPGWDRNSKTLSQFQDVRELQKALEASGLKFVTKADASTTGPASFMVIDPDGNPVLVDQHVPAPGK